jgi:hypothetical protein
MLGRVGGTTRTSESDLMSTLAMVLPQLVLRRSTGFSVVLLLRNVHPCWEREMRCSQYSPQARTQLGE